MKKTPFMFCFLLAWLLTACTEEMINKTPSNPYEEGLEEVLMPLRCMPVQVVGEEWSASPDTRVADSSIKDNLISNIWVFQYDKSGNQITSPHYYTLSANTLDSGTANVMLRPATDCQVYVLANTNSNTWLNGLDVSTLTKLKKLTHTFASESEAYGGSNKNLMMSGSAKATIKAGESNTLTGLSLKRMFAMITFQYKFADSDLAKKLKVTRITLNSGPNTLQIEEPTGIYPSSAFTPIDYSVITSPVAGTYYTGYVLDNLQGTTTNTDQKTKNEKAPANAISIKLYIDSEVDGGSYVYTVYPGENNVNDFNIKRNYKYKLNLNLKSSITDSRVMAAPANCFVMRQNASIVFDPYERTESGGGWQYSTYVDKTVPARSFSRVEILWQTGDGSKFAIGNNASGTRVYLKDGKVYVTAGNTDGNAVIAGYNSNGIVLWSWHIWVNDSSPAQVANAVKYTTYNWDSSTIYSGTRVSGYSFMSCNLGALNTTPGNIYTYGLYYQWGRKDPFPQVAKIVGKEFYAYASPNITSLYNNQAQQINMSSTVGSGEVFQTKRIDAATGNIKYAIQNPTTYMATTVPAQFENGSESDINYGNDHRSTHDATLYVNDGDWYWGHNDKLWGGIPFNDATINFQNIVANNGAINKSLFDPCPSGWMLPKSDAWMGFTNTGLNTNTYETQNFVSPEQSQLLHGMSFYMETWRSGNTSFFPYCGWRTGDGSCFVVDICGGYYTSAASFNNATSILHIHTRAGDYDHPCVHPYDYGYQYARRSCAYPVRCVREVKGE